MKVVLLEDVKGTGKKGQVINVSDGHAKNFLLPRKLAAEATASVMNTLEEQKKSAEHKRQKDIAAAQKIAEQIRDSSIKIKMKVGENGKMFGSVSNKEIAEALYKQTGIEIDKKKIVLPEVVKTLGTHQVQVKLQAEVSVLMTFEITAED